MPSPPIIDIESLDADAACGDAIHAACLDTGFFVAVGHGIDVELAAMFDAARAFFALPQARKEATPRRDRYGFVPLRSAALDRDRASDRTEFIDLGMGDEVPMPDLSGFGEAVRGYRRAALRVASQLLEVLAHRLGAGPSFFADRMTAPQCRLRLLHYPAVDAQPDGSLPVPTTPHTDYGTLTLLATDGVPGLEVRPLDGRWTPVESPAGSLVVNLGDMLARWTNDLYRSTPHRVVGPPSGDRLSIPFFVNPDPDAIVECIPSCVTPERPCAYPPIAAGEYLAARIDGSLEPYVDASEGPARRVSG